ncbi:MAG TPA: hypothetical protein VIT22_10295 [Pseudoxanthomonas sp.]
MKKNMLKKIMLKKNMLMLSLLAAIAAPAAAQDIKDLAPIAAPPTAQFVTVKDLAAETGLPEHRIRMVIGARSGYAEYRVTFDRAQRQFRNALGEERYNDLMAGRKIELHRQKAATVAAADTKR